MRSLKEAGFLPRTWADRGMMVPFTTPELALARMRHSSSGREFLLPNLSGGKGDYVLHWKAIRAMMPVTMFDRLLYDLIEKHEVTTPLQMHSAKLQAVASGLAGPLAARKAIKEMEQEQEYRLFTTFTLILTVLKNAGVAGPDLVANGLHSQTTQHHIQLALGEVAARIGLTYDELYSRIEVLASLLAPLGLGSAAEAGLLRLLTEDMNPLCQSLRDISEAGLDDIQTLADFEANAAEFVAKRAAAQIDQIDGMVESALNILSSWDTHSERLIAAILELSWLLDGWGPLVQTHRTSQLDSREQQAALVVELFPRLPAMPTSVRDGGIGMQIENLAVIQRRRVRGHTDWRSGRVDMELLRRMEAPKVASQPG